MEDFLLAQPDTSADRCDVSAVVASCQRVEALIKTLFQIRLCRPLPSEILVHVDGGSPAVLAALREHCPEARVLVSEVLLGPGGARNRLVAEAANELVASFDDDSFPADRSYFARVLHLARLFPSAAVFSAASHQQERLSSSFLHIAVFSGCGCVFRRTWFGRIQGFVPLPIAYNMEEVDVSLQLHELGGVIVHDPCLHVLHDHPPIEKVAASTNAHILANTALFPFLRYPMLAWPLGVWSVLRRLIFLISKGWTAGMYDGLRMIPRYLRLHAASRRSVSVSVLHSWLRLKRRPVEFGSVAALPARQSSAGAC